MTHAYDEDENELAALDPKTLRVAIEAMRNDPFVDDANLLGSTQQDQRMAHYAETAILAYLAALSPKPDGGALDRAALESAKSAYMKVAGTLPPHGVSIDEWGFQAVEAAIRAYIINAKGAKWTAQKNRPTNIEAWPGYTVEPLYSEATLATLREERDRLVKDAAEVKALSAQYMEDTGQAYCYIGIRDYAAISAKLAAASASNEALRVALEKAHDLIANTAFDAGESLEWATSVDEVIQAALTSNQGEGR